MSDVIAQPAVDAGSNGMIVVVDDDLDICTSIEEILRHQGYRVRTVVDGLKLLTTLAKEKPDLILLDVMMPAVNGVDLCRTLKRSEEFHDIPVVMMSALGERNDVHSVSSGAAEYLRKPFDLRQLMTCVHGLI